MKTTALRLYGKRDLRLETFELPEIGPDEILARIISDSVCMSSYKASEQGSAHKRVPNDVDKNPVIIGHEFCGVIEKVGINHQNEFQPGQRFAIQPAINYKGSLDSPGYSFPYIGGDATHIVIPSCVMEVGCLLHFDAAFYKGSLGEPMSCIVGAFHAAYHTQNGSYVHQMGVREGGKMALLASAGPMGIGAIDYAVHGPRRPSFLVVTDIDDSRLQRAASLITPEDALKNGVTLVYKNTASTEDPAKMLLELTGGAGYDDVFAFAPVQSVVEQADAILGRDGCLNFFAGPTNTAFSAKLNFYNVHYASTHIVGTSGGNTDDMLESLDLMEKGLINPACMVTHIGGLDAAAETILNLPKIPGGKKLIYVGVSMPLTALEDLPNSSDPTLRKLGQIVQSNHGLWCEEAENYLLANAAPICVQ